MVKGPSGARPEPRRFLTDRMRRIEELVRGAAYLRLAKAGYALVRPSGLRVMARLSPEGLRQGELARRLGVTKQAVTQLVDRLERLGYVERVRDSSDARSIVVRPTPRAAGGYRVGAQAIVDWERAVERKLGKSRADELRRTLAELEEWMGDGGWR